jgi:outer membrane protein OmpU
MNNLKKIGLSALAGSLAAVSANAVELSVSGKTEITYVTADSASVGNPYGMGNMITFSGSGDVNGMTATYTAALQDGGSANSNNSEAFASSSLMLDMGDFGTVGFDQGVGEFGVGTIDDKTPYAYEEQWTYTGASNGLRAAGGTNVLGYKNSYMGYTLSVELDPGHTNNSTKGGSGDGGSTGAEGAADSGVNWALTGSPMDGLNIGVGQGKEESTHDVSQNDAQFTTGFVTYAIEGATVGYQRSSARGGSEASTNSEVEIMGISYQINENAAVSYSTMTNTFSTVATAADVDEDTKGFGASYTMGSAAIRVLASDTDNVGGVATANEEHVEVSLMLAF